MDESNLSDLNKHMDEIQSGEEQFEAMQEKMIDKFGFELQVIIKQFEKIKSEYGFNEFTICEFADENL